MTESTTDYTIVNLKALALPKKLGWDEYMVCSVTGAEVPPGLQQVTFKSANSMGKRV